MNTDPHKQTTSDKPSLGHTINSHANITPTDVSPARSIIDPLFWLLALLLLIGSTLIPQYLPAYWAPASNVWVRVAAIAGSVVLALILLYITSQGKAFVVLLKDSRIELRRITWPTKQDTLQTTWVVLAVVVVMAIILWLMDLFFGWAIQLFIG
ncbi:MAG: preprotein translocase subunit SecE [Gammaproteobacteria bacterium]|nr:preprotein translocase subunit SecE [Gammaproteobacteria bacterium]